MRNLSKLALSVLSTLMVSSIFAQCPVGSPCYQGNRGGYSGGGYSGGCGPGGCGVRNYGGGQSSGYSGGGYYGGQYSSSYAPSFDGGYSYQSPTYTSYPGSNYSYHQGMVEYPVDENYQYSQGYEVNQPGFIQQQPGSWSNSNHYWSQPSHQGSWSSSANYQKGYSQKNYYNPNASYNTTGSEQIPTNTRYSSTNPNATLQDNVETNSSGNPSIPPSPTPNRNR